MGMTYTGCILHGGQIFIIHNNQSANKFKSTSFPTKPLIYHDHAPQFATPETTDGLGSGTSTQMVPEGNATNINFKRTNNTQSF